MFIGIDNGEFDEDILEIDFEEGSYTDSQYRPSNPIVKLFIREDGAYKSFVINGRNSVQVVSGIKRRSDSGAELVNDTARLQINKEYKPKKKFKSHIIKPRIVIRKLMKRYESKIVYS